VEGDRKYVSDVGVSIEAWDMPGFGNEPLVSTDWEYLNTQLGR
jgi:hypothetical protein